MSRALLISNGSGEDRIAAQLGMRWREAVPGIELEALALVGTGTFYLQAGIPLVSQGFSPPSQGFAYLNPALLLKDFQAGLGGHLLRSLKWLGQRRGHYDQVLAVGDIVAVIAASRLKQPFAFFGSALSDHYLEAAGEAGRTCWDPVQIHVLKQQRCLVFARDALTAINLQRRGLNAHFVGNPMLDCLDAPQGECPYQTCPERHLVLLLPGSHADAGANFALMLEQLGLSLEMKVDLVLLRAPQVNEADLQMALSHAGWNSEGAQWRTAKASLQILDSCWFGQLLPQAALAIGLAGTANEQCVGHGLPVLSFATPNQQYTWAFGEAQQRLLGSGLSFIGEPHPLILAKRIKAILADSSWRKAAGRIGNERFGRPGGDKKMIATLLKWGSPGK